MRSRPAAIPFLRHEFLAALEHTGCVGAGTGWEPRYLALRDARGLAGAAPVYLKTHSSASSCSISPGRRPTSGVGRRYYPKLTLARAVHARHRPAPAGAPRRRSRRGGRATARRARGLRRRPRTVLGCTPCSSTSRGARRARSAAGCCAATASSTGPTTATRLRGLPRSLHRREAQEGRRERRRVRGSRHPLRDALRRRARRGAASMRIYALHRDTFLRARPRALPDTRRSSARSRARCREALMVKLAVHARHAGAPPRSSSGASRRSTAATGAPPPTTTACISRPATTRASSTASSAASRASSPARRASTR